MYRSPMHRLLRERLTADQLAKMGRPAQILIDSDWLCAGCVPDLRLRRSLERCPHSPELPLLSRGQLLSKDHEWDQVAEAYLVTLSPIGKPAPLGQWNNIRVRRGSRRTSLATTEGDGKVAHRVYSRRCVMKLTEEKQGAKHGAA